MLSDKNATYLCSKIISTLPQAKKPRIRQPAKKKSKCWDEEVEEAWTQFQNYLNGKESIDSQEIIQFLNFSWQTKNMAVGSMVNLKVRLSLAYKKYTGTVNQN